MKKKIIVTLLLCCITLSNCIVPVTVSSQPISSEYKDAVMKKDYIGNMSYSVPNNWIYEDSLSDSMLTRNYIISKGQLMMIFFSKIENTVDLSNDYSYAAAIFSSIVDGMSDYSEISRQQSSVSGYPALAISYTWKDNNGGLVYSYAVAVVTNDGAYVFNNAFSSAYRDTDLEEDVWKSTFGSIEQISYSDPEIIKSVQTTLNSLGYDCGAPDGIVGSGTQSAIQKYRSDKGLTDSGEIDAELLNSFNSTDSTSSTSASTEEKVHITFSSSVPNDVTGKWRLATVNTDIPIENYLLSYYKNYFKSDDEIHAIINTYDNTTTSVSVLAGMFSVTVHQYISGEENDAKILFSGDVISDEFYSMETGEIINF